MIKFILSFWFISSLSTPNHFELTNLSLKNILDLVNFKTLIKDF